ncbi:MAG: hypothetical protein [Arizlama microvirus]|nr:MAG: hypothetical protein [Arizlama microvirus]
MIQKKSFKKIIRKGKKSHPYNKPRNFKKRF